MKNFDSTFTTICEETLYRYQQGGFLRGDYVKIKKSALSNPLVKEMSEQLHAILENAIKQDIYYRISYIKSGHSEAPQGPVDAPNIPGRLWADVIIEYAPGMWKDPLTLPLEVLEKVELDGEMSGYPQYSSKIKRENNLSDDGPKSVEQTMGRDDTRNLTTKNTKLANTSNPKSGHGAKKINETYNALRENDVIFDTYMQTTLKTKLLNEGIMDWAGNMAKKVGDTNNLNTIANNPEELAAKFSELKQISPEKLKEAIKYLLDQGRNDAVQQALQFQRQLRDSGGEDIAPDLESPDTDLDSPELKESHSILEPIIQQVYDATDFEEAKQLVLNTIENSRINPDSKIRMIHYVKNTRNLPHLQKYVTDSMLKKLGMGSMNRRDY